MKANIEFSKGDISEMMKDSLRSQGFQLAEGGDFDWRTRPKLHVQAAVEPLQLNADSETKAITNMTQRLRSCMSELQQMAKYGQVIHLLERAIVHLEHDADDIKNGVIPRPMSTIASMVAALDDSGDDAAVAAAGDIPALAPPPSMANARTVRIETDVTPPEKKFSSDISTIIQKSRQLLANERLEDPRKAR